MQDYMGSTFDCQNTPGHRCINTIDDDGDQQLLCPADFSCSSTGQVLFGELICASAPTPGLRVLTCMHAASTVNVRNSPVPADPGRLRKNGTESLRDTSARILSRMPTTESQRPLLC